MSRRVARPAPERRGERRLLLSPGQHPDGMDARVPVEPADGMRAELSLVDAPAKRALPGEFPDAISVVEPDLDQAAIGSERGGAHRDAHDARRALSSTVASVGTSCADGRRSPVPSSRPSAYTPRHSESKMTAPPSAAMPISAAPPSTPASEHSSRTTDRRTGTS